MLKPDLFGNMGFNDKCSRVNILSMWSGCKGSVASVYAITWVVMTVNHVEVEEV
jgi:hypothetical protein